MPASSQRRELVGFVAVVIVASLGWEAFSAWHKNRLGAEVAQRARPGDIQMISSVNCVFCTRARQWFTEHQVPFDECFIERDDSCQALYAALQAPGTPVLRVRGQRQVGFTPQAVHKALGG